MRGKSDTYKKMQELKEYLREKFSSKRYRISHTLPKLKRGEEVCDRYGIDINKFYEENKKSKSRYIKLIKQVKALVENYTQKEIKVGRNKYKRGKLILEAYKNALDELNELKGKKDIKYFLDKAGFKGKRFTEKTEKLSYKWAERNKDKMMKLILDMTSYINRVKIAKNRKK